MNQTRPRLLKRKSVRQRQRENVMAVGYAKFAHQQLLHANMMVCALLAQAGGEMTLTQGTLDQCLALIDTIGYQMTETVKGREYQLRMVLGPDDPLPVSDNASPAKIVITV
jgi:hypothetical protein